MNNANLAIKIGRSKGIFQGRTLRKSYSFIVIIIAFMNWYQQYESLYPSWGKTMLLI